MDPALQILQDPFDIRKCSKGFPVRRMDIEIKVTAEVFICGAFCKIFQLLIVVKFGKASGFAVYNSNQLIQTSYRCSMFLFSICFTLLDQPVMELSYHNFRTDKNVCGGQHYI